MSSSCFSLATQAQLCLRLGKITFLPICVFYYFFIKNFFHTIYFDHFPLPQLLLDPTHPTLFSLSPSQKKKKNGSKTKKLNIKPVKIKTNWQKINKNNNNKKGKESKTKLKKSHKNIIKFVLCWPTTPGQGACSGVWLIYSVTFHWRKLIFSLPANSNCT